MALETFLYLRPDENVAAGAGVTGSIDAGYSAEWLTDQRHDTPVRGPGGGDLSLSLTLSAPSDVNLVVISHHDLDEDVVLSGDLSATITASAMLADGIPYNWFHYVGATPVEVSSFDLAITGNSRAPIIGEVFAGVAREMVPFKIDDADLDQSFQNDPGGTSWSMLPFDEGYSPPRSWGGSQYYTGAQKNELEQWFLSQRFGSRLSVLIPDETKQDAPLVRFTSFKAKPARPTGSDDLWLVSLLFEEFPRTRW